ncbi:MAG: hypothetical protein B6229_05615 [Spirochaetaceae bacterium 4572_7]|nr:MAG: hypothetical protein B6229_05615 [Spirochaetaceae bacterium 4572_7]
MNLKTSTKISIKFTIFTTIIVFLFGLFANIVFLQKRYSPLSRNVHAITTTNNTNKPRVNNIGTLKDHFRNNLTVKLDSIEYQTLKQNILIDKIGEISDNFFYFQEV